VSQLKGDSRFEVALSPRRAVGVGCCHADEPDRAHLDLHLSWTLAPKTSLPIYGRLAHDMADTATATDARPPKQVVYCDVCTLPPEVGTTSNNSPTILWAFDTL